MQNKKGEKKISEVRKQVKKKKKTGIKQNFSVFTSPLQFTQPKLVIEVKKINTALSVSKITIK